MGNKRRNVLKNYEKSLLNKFIALSIHIKQEEVVSYMFISC